MMKKYNVDMIKILIPSLELLGDQIIKGVISSQALALKSDMIASVLKKIMKDEGEKHE